MILWSIWLTIFEDMHSLVPPAVRDKYSVLDRETTFSWRHIKWFSYFTIDKYLYDFVDRDLWYIMIDRNICGYWRKGQITHDAKIVADRSMHHFVWLMWLTSYWMTCIILHNKWTSWHQHVDECNKEVFPFVDEDGETMCEWRGRDILLSSIPVWEN